jgi:hypothetical protein
MLRVLEPALRMKESTDRLLTAEVGKILFVENLFGEKRKTTCWRMQGDLETGDPVGQVGEWGFIACLHCLMAGDAFQMQTGRCFLGRRSVSLTS